MNMQSITRAGITISEWRLQPLNDTYVLRFNLVEIGKRRRAETNIIIIIICHGLVIF